MNIIMNGGAPLEGCPKNQYEADALLLKLNADVPPGKPEWSFDCGYKLDFDGNLIQILSRFYPPKTHYGPTWDGTVSLFFLGVMVSEKKFDCPTIMELKKQVEEYVNSIIGKLRETIGALK